MCYGSGGIGNCYRVRGNNWLRRKEMHEGPGNNDCRKNYQNDLRKNYQEVRELSNKSIQRLQRYDQCQQRSKHS